MTKIGYQSVLFDTHTQIQTVEYFTPGHKEEIKEFIFIQMTAYLVRTPFPLQLNRTNKFFDVLVIKGRTQEEEKA